MSLRFLMPAFVWTVLFISSLFSYAESVHLSPLVHDEPQGGYVFTALAPLPSVLPDVQEATQVPSSPKNTTQIVLKKK